MVKEYNLNDGQIAAAEGFFKFLFSDDKELIISGGGGVGKTYLMGYIIDETMKRYFEMCKLMDIEPKYDSVHMTSTTNKATEVLSIATNRPTRTIHSFLGLKVANDLTSGKTRIQRNKTWKPHHNCIIFIDECSMIDKALRREILDGTINCKIVYVGDHCQLAPVGETLSPIYNQQSPFFELTEPMRNADQPALMHLCRQFRHTVETGEFFPIEIVPGVIDLLDDEQMEAKIAEVFTEQNHNSKILAYTNQRVIQYNDHIRDLRQLPYEYTAGEILVNNSPVTIPGIGIIPAEEEIEILKMDDPVDIQLGQHEGEPVFMTVQSSQVQCSLMGRFDNVMIPYDRAHHQELIKFYGRQKNWERYYFLKESFPDLRQRDASTVYKAQGSTYDSVFIDLTNISTCNIPAQVARMLYVAVSRPRHRIYLYGNLADKYGGLFIS